MIITHCNNCPFNAGGGEHEHYCNIAKDTTKENLKKDEDGDDYDEFIGYDERYKKSFSPYQMSIHYDFNVDDDSMPKTNTTSWGRYHFETLAIPPWCPLRKVTAIKFLGAIMKIIVNLDKKLFEENFWKLR